MEESYDLVVIGGGSAGYAAAEEGSRLGMKVALVEGAQRMGGLCINRGCMPSKALIETANRMREIREAARFGIGVPEGAAVDMELLQERRERLIDGFQEERAEQLEESAFDLIRGHARFEDAHLVSVDSGMEVHKLRFRTAVVATGSTPRVPEFEGLSEVPFWVSKDALKAQELPEHLVVVGGGAIGCELGSCFEGLGSKVTIVSRSSALLDKMPEASSKVVEAGFRRKGINLRLGYQCRAVREAEGKLVLTIEKDGECEAVEASHLLIAAGRTPRLDGLELKAASVDSSRKGITTNAGCQTSQPHIFAVGDCADGLDIVHHAVIEGSCAARNARAFLQGESLEPADKSPTIVAVFSDPEVIHIGPSADELQETSGLTSRSFSLVEFGKGELKGLDEGKLTVTFETESRKLVAATGVGRGVIDFSHSMVFAIRQGTTIEEMLEVPHYHPTMAESWTYLEGD